MIPKNGPRKAVCLSLPLLALAPLVLARQQAGIGGLQAGRVAVAPQSGKSIDVPPDQAEQMRLVISSVRVPAGSILAFAGDTAPIGYLLCDGTEVLRDDYPALFSALGESWGSATNFTFTLPDLRGRFLRGVDGAAGNDPDRNSRSAIAPGGSVGNNVGSLQVDARRGISGTVAGTTSASGAHTHDILTAQDDWDEDDGNGSAHNPGWADDALSGATNYKDTESAGSHTHTFSVSATFVGDAETRPKNAYVNYIIKF